MLFLAWNLRWTWHPLTIAHAERLGHGGIGHERRLQQRVGLFAEFWPEGLGHPLAKQVTANKPARIRIGPGQLRGGEVGLVLILPRHDERMGVVVRPETIERARHGGVHPAIFSAVGDFLMGRAKSAPLPVNPRANLGVIAAELTVFVRDRCQHSLRSHAEQIRQAQDEMVDVSAEQAEARDL